MILLNEFPGDFHLLMEIKKAGMDGSRTHRGLQSSPPRGFEDRGIHRDPTIPTISIIERFGFVKNIKTITLRGLT
jgi:hypothetical protein